MPATSWSIRAATTSTWRCATGPAATRVCTSSSCRPGWCFPCAGPILLERGPALETLADLRHHALLHVEWRHTSRAVPDWRSWLEAVGGPDIDTGPGPRFGQQSMGLDAAAAGQGVALADDLVAANDLAAGRLVRPLDDAAPQAFGYFLVCLPETAETARVRAFRDWVFAELEQSDVGP